MIDLNNRDTPKVRLNNQEMVKKVSDRTSVSTNPIKRYIAGKEEGRRIKGGDSQQERGSGEKSKKKNKREKKK